MQKIVLIGLVILLAFLFTPIAHADPAFRLGSGTGIVFPDMFHAFKVLGELSLTDLISLRTTLEFSSLFGVFILPLDEIVIFQFGQEPEFYLGVGIGLLMMRSAFGTTTHLSYSGVGGIEFASASLSLFTQLKFRSSGERVTYQLDMGVIF